ncbi:MAG: peptidoglycan DD-metalloendopeptidase family protein [Syntrophomonadaceae bacterium]|jgi:murein DD-endopeptidase MepM/ murein hydrolase activator NlpD
MIRWFKKQFRGRITFILIPPSAHQPNRFMLSPAIMMMGLIAGLSFLIIASTVAYLYFQGQADIRNVQAIQDDNRRKQKTIQSLNEEIQLIEAEQQNLDRKQKELQKMMGIKPAESTSAEPLRGGQGGSDEAVSSSDDVEALVKIQDIKTRLYRQEFELDELMARVSNNQDYFRCIPNGWPVKGELTSAFGYRQSPFGRSRETFHNGIDIACNGGSEVLAAGDGLVTRAGWEGVYGRAIVIDHGYGLQTMYGHNARLMVEEGDQVYKGQVIALSGNSGRSTGPHLHFTLMRYGQAIDPMVYLPRWQ